MSPFKSEKQRKYLWANEPEVAEEFAKAEKTRRERPVSRRSKKRKRRKAKK